MKFIKRKAAPAPTLPRVPARPLPAPLPASTWGPDTTRILAREDEYLAYLASLD